MPCLFPRVKGTSNIDMGQTALTKEILLNTFMGKYTYFSSMISSFSLYGTSAQKKDDAVYYTGREKEGGKSRGTCETRGD